MKKEIIIIVLLVLASLFYFSFKQKRTILFYSLSCPHCQEVEDYIQTNKIKEKFPLTEKEVSQNQQNGQALVKAAQSCGLSTDTISVPFLSNDGQCIVGADKIIEYLTTKKAQINQ